MKQNHFKFIQLFCFVSRMPKPSCHGSINFHHGCHQKAEMRKELIYSTSREKAPEGLYCPAVMLQIHTECATRLCTLPCPGLWLLVCKVSPDATQVTLDLSGAHGTLG